MESCEVMNGEKKTDFLSIITDIPKIELDQNLLKEIAITSEVFSEGENAFEK